MSAPVFHLYFCLWDALSFHQCHCQRKDVPSLDGSASWRCDTNFSAIYIIPVLFITIVWNIPRSAIFCQFFQTVPFLNYFSYFYCPRRRKLKLLNKKLAPQKNQNFTQMHWWLGSGNCRRVILGRMPLTRFWTLVLWCDHHWKWWLWHPWWRSRLIQTQIWQKEPKFKYLYWPVWRTLCQWLIAPWLFLSFRNFPANWHWSLNASTICAVQTGSGLHRSAATSFNFKVEFQMNCKWWFKMKKMKSESDFSLGRG